MVNIKKNWKGILSCILIFIIIVLLVKTCEQHNVNKQTAQRQENHDQIINHNADNSTIEAQFRASKDSLIQAYNDSLDQQLELINRLESQDKEVVVKYIKTPTLDNGRAVIASKDKVISGLKGESKIKDKVISEKDQQLESFGNEVQQHKLTISELDKEFQMMNGQLAKAKKPKRFGLGIQAGYGTTVTNIKPAPYVGVGISYNLIRLWIRRAGTNLKCFVKKND